MANVKYMSSKIKYNKGLLDLTIRKSLIEQDKHFKELKTKTNLVWVEK